MGVHISKDAVKGLSFDEPAGNSGFQADEGLKLGAPQSPKP